MATVQTINPCPESETNFADGQKAPPAGQQAIAVDATLASRQAQICSADMAAVRGRLTPEQSTRCSDQMVNQFLRATLSNVDQVGLQLCSWTVHCWQEGQAPVCFLSINEGAMVHVALACTMQVFCAGGLQICSCLQGFDIEAVFCMHRQ